MRKTTITSQHFFVFSADYQTSPNSRPRSITVAFFALKSATGGELADLLAEYFVETPITEELLIVAPADLVEILQNITVHPLLKDRLEHSPLGKVRAATIEADGVWSVPTKAESLSHRSVHQIVQDGLRQIFSSGGGLLTSHGGYHFSKPSGSHAEHFLRAGNVFVRSPQVYFMACACLPWISQHQFTTVVVDSGSISALGYAIASVRRRLSPGMPEYAIDSFGGYSGLPEYRQPDPLDTIVIMSASTSGRLADRIEEFLRVPRHRQLILFYVGRPHDSVEILCDLTLRSKKEYEPGFLPEIRSWKKDACPLCKNGQPVIELEGDAFLPAAGTITQRLIVHKYGGQHLSPLMEEFYGLDAFRVRGSDLATTPRQRTVLIRYGHLLDPAHPHKEIRKKIEASLERFMPLMVGSIVTFNDPESKALAGLAKQLIEDRTARTVELIYADSLANREESLPSGHAVVIAGVVVGGRQLLNVSRFLRTLHEGEEIAYYVGVARPRTKQSWTELSSSLRFGPSGPNHYRLETCWYVECDPDRPEYDAWFNEAQLLQKIKQRMNEINAESDVDSGQFEELIALRLGQINQIGRTPGGATANENASATSTPLFVPSSYSTSSPESHLELNPNFAFWKFRFTEHPASVNYSKKPSEDEVFFTISTVLHNSRHSEDGKYALFDEGGSRYVLSPVNFHRFNDPIIQSSILRSARNMELDYRTDRNVSAYVCDMILSLVAEWNSEQGRAAVEFLISLCGGLGNSEAGYLRLHSTDLEKLVKETEQSLESMPPYARMLLLYMKHVHYQAVVA
ncbi:hypothetical protein AB0N33_18525 [Pseudarthrobacter oxydans]|uniref:hypothetical protein n=1 Tax=Pseudarthrobacter oxydans TaxID=1671 RepID=UPI0034173B1B